MNTPALEIVDLRSWQGVTPLLRGVSLTLQPGEAVALTGSDADGGPSILHAVQGRTERRTGSVRIHGTECIAMSQGRIAELGAGGYPDGEPMLEGMTCEEALLLPADTGALGGGMSLPEIYTLLPSLQAHRHWPCTRLRGDERHMLGLSRILRTGADVLLLHGLFTGLATPAARAVMGMIAALKARGYAIVLAEPDVRGASALIDRVYAMAGGRLAAARATPAAAGSHGVPIAPATPSSVSSGAVR